MMEIWALLFLLSFSPAGNMVAGADSFGNVILWNTQTSRPMQTLKTGDAPVTAVDIRPDGKYMVSGTQDGTVALWNLDSRTIIKTEQAHADAVVSVDFSNNGNFMLTAGRDGTVAVWTMPEFIRFGFVMTDAGQLFTADMSGDAKWITATSNDGALYVWKGPKNWTRVSRIEAVNALSAAFDSSGNLIVTGGSDGVVKAFRGSGDQWSMVRNWNITTNPINSVTFCPDGACVYLVANYKTIYSLPLRENAQPKQLHQSDNVRELGVWDTAISPNGRALARIDSKGVVRVERR